MSSELETKVNTTRAGGAYIPPHRLRQMQQNVKDTTTEEYQRITWEALKKSINGLINKVNTSNVKMIIPELFGENLVRGRGLYCRSMMKAQTASLPFTPVYAAVTAVVNTKLPAVGALLLTRLVLQFRRAFRRNDKTSCLATTMFIAHLTNQLIADKVLALQILALLLERPTDDSVEIAVGFMREVGALLANVCPKANNAIYERFRAVLHEGEIDKRIQYMIEVLFQVRKDKYKDNQPVMEELDLVEEDDQITHNISLDDDDLDAEEMLNIFKYDPNYDENEAKYSAIKAEILGEDGSDESGSSGDDESGSASEDDEEDDEEENKMEIMDQTNNDIIELRRKIYLTVMSSVNFEEACHKLMKLHIPEGHEVELCNMIIECASQERTYLKYYGLMAERFCKMNRTWVENFTNAFNEIYDTIHRYETNRLRNIGKLFAHLFNTDSLPWTAFQIIRLTEEDTTSASRIFVKILFQEISEFLGLKTLKERLLDPYMLESLSGMFPKDNPKNTRFAINYWTSIGLGALTEELRDWLRTAPQQMMKREVSSSSGSSSSGSDSDSSSGSSSSGSDSDSGSSSSGSDSDSRSRRRRPSRRSSRRGRSSSSSGSSRSRSPSTRRHRNEGHSRRRRSSTPPRRR
ncbi:MIF4G-domain-containing protein [Mucor mucedo]|uniref:MIF4G-domain-containing protein n=1 Tax=Mucor mucedo TaxID=29922 RepID=UPI00221FFE99|nr:MIF4G-domain-containing protein [Mucor mucedo]KAI7895112.1 MIF4G-domain-containing protein [Mucor mucedo]